jgi:hypothetical protein
MKKTVTSLIFTILIMACFILSIFGVALLCLASTSAMWTDERGCTNGSSQIQLLKDYVPTNERNSINPHFYTYFGFRDWYRFPLVYPYGIHALETLDKGILKNESQVVDFEKAWQNSDSILSNIQSFTFDKNYFLAATDDDFVLFNFDTQEINSFGTMQELTIEAKRQNFTGSMKFMTLSEYDDLFTCSK